jgi:hypothetical protein
LLNEKDKLNLNKLLISIGNLTYKNFENRSIAKDIDIPTNLKELIIECDDQIGSQVEEIKNYLITLLA